jgi:hypothetical protein
MKIIHYFFCLISTCLLILPGCNQSNAWEEESKGLLQEAEQIELQHSNLNARIDSLWDTTTEALAAAIPEDFPPTDREIFLNARNADHIRMFMSFKELSPETQALVDAAGKYDAMLATEIKTLQSKKEDFEKRKMQFLRIVDEQSKEASQQFAEQFRNTTAIQTN